MVAIALRPQAFEEDCPRAALVVSRRTAPPGCAATVVDRDVSARSGALSFTRDGQGWAVSAAQPAGYDRPWAPGWHQAAAPASARAAPDATPDAASDD
jgi:competence protein ComEC